jgi:hypothetical protein
MIKYKSSKINRKIMVSGDYGLKLDAKVILKLQAYRGLLLIRTWFLDTRFQR